MKFTSLKLTGFKSFVDPTELLIEPGLTAIVGPNGCGKSNLLEALRWVMGETSPKSMRGSGMEDVIFAGTAMRPARNMAEVKLVIDNAERKAPSAFNGDDLLEISRRIEKDAGSNYRVNGRDLRAKDVQLFFADMSSGAHSPSLVRQGQIGQLINAKPRDRRQILEEAAGISGLHSRRHEAELRLRAAENNLARVDDMLQQLQGQLSSLKRQARQASKYRDLSKEIRQAEAIVLHLRWREAAEAVAAAEEALREIELAVAARTEEAAAASRAEARASEKLPPLREAEAEAASALHRLEVERDALDAEERRAREEEARLVSQLEEITSDLERERAMIRDSERETARLTEECERLEAARRDEGGELERHREQAERSRDALMEQEAELDRLTRAMADAGARRASLERAVLDLRKRRARIAARISEAAAEAEALRESSGDMSAATAAETACREAAAASEEAERALAGA
ncbi:MAG: AAA family ATPase, partial [Alphaproteobacteria bacterium]